MAAKIALQIAGATVGNARFTQAGRGFLALSNVNMGLPRCFLNPGHGIVVKVQLLYLAILGSDLTQHAMLVLKTAARSNCARTRSGRMTVPASTAKSTRGIRTSPLLSTWTSTTAAT